MGISSVSFPGFWILPFKKLHAFITYIFNEIMGSWQLMERPPKWGCGGTMHSQLWTPQVVSRWARLQTVALQGWAVQGSWTSVSTPGKATIQRRWYTEDNEDVSFISPLYVGLSMWTLPAALRSNWWSVSWSWLEWSFSPILENSVLHHAVVGTWGWVMEMGNWLVGNLRLPYLPQRLQSNQLG